MKRSLLFAALCASSLSAFAASGPYTITTPGTGAGSLTISTIYADGNIQGDNATFNPGSPATPNTTCWRNWFLVHNVTDNTRYWADFFPAHTPDVPDGVITTNLNGFSNTGINFANNLTANLVVALSNPTAGDTARLDFTWTFFNAGASAKSVRIVWDYDYDGYIVGGYTNDMVSRVTNTLGGGYGLAQGENASGSVDLNPGIKMESSIPITSYYGIAHVDGSGYYWSNEDAYLGKGPEVSNAIHATHANTIENDANNDKLVDSPRDTAGVLQVDFSVPAGGNTPVTLRVTWGLNETSSGNAAVQDWAMY